MTVAFTGALLGPDPGDGAVRWAARGLVQSTYAGLLAFFVWSVLRRWRKTAYILLLGLACAAVAIWDVGHGLYVNRLRVEANNALSGFREAPLTVVGLPGIIERNPYVEAYMVMRDVYWDLGNRMDERMADYSATYESYVVQGQFLDIARLQSRYELWRAYYQIADLEARLAAIDTGPLDADELGWTVDLLDVDPETRRFYARDLEEALAAARAAQGELIAREQQTLSQIKRSLQVLIDARGRYRFAEGRVVFEDPADAALFAGKEPPGD